MRNYFCLDQQETHGLVDCLNHNWFPDIQEFNPWIGYCGKGVFSGSVEEMDNTQVNRPERMN